MKRANPERQIHAAVVQHLRLRGVEGLVFLHPNNNVRRKGKAGIIQGALGKAMGVLAGASDLLLFHSGQFFALELQGRQGQDLTRTRRIFVRRAECWWHGVVRKGFPDEALITLRHWGLLKGVVGRTAK